jgi:hypothetical protein
MALDRENHNGMPGRPRTPEFLVDAPNAFAHYREPNEGPTVLFERNGQQPRATADGAPYIIWLIASVLAGIISYYVAPEILGRYQSAHTTVAVTKKPASEP